MPELELPGATLHYEFDDRPGRPAVVLSNPLGADLSFWAEQMEPFSRHFSVLRYDGRGQGRSSIPAGPYNVAALGADVLALLDALQVSRVHFCGISMGGMVGQWLGIHAAHRLHRLVLSNTAAKIGSAARWNERIATVEREGLQAIVPAVLKGWFTESFHGQSPAAIERMRTMLLGNDPAGYVASCAAVREADQRSEVAKISLPTLVVYGTQDASTPPEDAMFLIDHIAGAQALELQAAHISNVEAASTFNSGVLEFLLEGAL